jgi:hypothetical protein
MSMDDNVLNLFTKYIAIENPPAAFSKMILRKI